MEERKDLWEDLRRHQDALMFKGKRWMLMGDYNEILEGEEHSGFENSPRLPGGMRDFQDIVRHCKLLDMSYQGPRFTWCNKREQGLIYKKLDRVLVNEEWILGSPTYCVFEAGGCSDHLRCRVELDLEEKRKRRPFKFTNIIAKMPEFLPLMEDQWRNHEPLYHSTSALFRLTKRLKALKMQLRILSKKKLGDLSRRTRETFLVLCEKQKATMMNPIEASMQEEINAYTKWKRLADLEEEYLKQRSKVHWLDVGDGNNRFFHCAAKIREVRNSIREIQRADGSWAKTEEDIKEEAGSFFKEFMEMQPQDFEGVTVERIRELLDFRCSEIDCAKLEREVTKEEIVGVKNG